MPALALRACLEPRERVALAVEQREHVVVDPRGGRALQGVHERFFLCHGVGTVAACAGKRIEAQILAAATVGAVEPVAAGKPLDPLAVAVHQQVGVATHGVTIDRLLADLDQLPFGVGQADEVGRTRAGAEHQRDEHRRAEKTDSVHEASHWA